METATAEQVAAALAAVTVWPPDLGPDDRYEPVGSLDPAPYVAAVGRRLGGPPERVGQSALFMGVASRLWSVLVVPAVLDCVLVDPEAIVVRHDDGAVVLGVRRSEGGRDPSVDDVLEATLAVLGPLAERLPLSPRLLWGNAAASLYAVPRVHALPGTEPLVEALVELSPFAGELDLLGEGRARRRTCCLFYEVPGAGLCGDCVFDHPPRSWT
jgi:hypothetical protein